MTFARYLKDHVGSAALMACCMLSVGLIAAVAGLHSTLVAFLCCAVCAFWLASLVWGYLRKRTYYREVSELLDIAGDRYLVTELAPGPSSAEQLLFHEALARATKDMNDRIAAYRAAGDEYRDYIETWTHEVKTPIAAARLIAENNPGEAMRDLAAELQRIEGYAEQALFYARSTTLEKDYLIREVSLDAVVKDTVKAHARVLIEAGVMPSFHGLDVNVYTDPKWISFVLGQLTMNAVEYRCTDGTRAPLLEFAAVRESVGLDTERVVLTVADNGIGVPSEDVDRVFDRGFTGQNGRARGHSTGMGLYLCRQLCRKMGLGIWLESDDGRGTRVSIGFPLNKMLLC